MGCADGGRVRRASGAIQRHRAAAAAAAQAFASADAPRAHEGRRHVSVIAVAPRGRAVASRHALASTEAARAQDRCQVSSLAVAAAPVALAAIHARASLDAARVQVGFCHVSLFIFDSISVEIGALCCENVDLI